MRLNGWTPLISSHEIASTGALPTSFGGEWSQSRPDESGNVLIIGRQIFSPSFVFGESASHAIAISAMRWLDYDYDLTALMEIQRKWIPSVFAQACDSGTLPLDGDVYLRPSDEYISDFYEYSKMAYQSVAAFHVFQRVSRLLTNKRYHIVDEMMAKSDPSKMSVQVMLAFLRMSLDDKARFKHWDSAVLRVKNELTRRGKKPDALMADILE